MSCVGDLRGDEGRGGPNDGGATVKRSGRLGDRDIRRWTGWGTLASVAVFWLIGTAGQPRRLFSMPQLFTSNFFDIQARSLMSGGLSVPPGSLLFEEFVTPRGSHMYFGILPALLRVPVLTITTGLDGRLTLASCLAAVIVMSVCTARLARRAQCVFFRDGIGNLTASPRWYALIAAAPGLLSPVLFLASQSLVYNEAAAWGVATALWGVDAALEWWYQGRRSDLCWMVLAIAAAISTRPTVGAIPLLLVMGLVAVLILRGRVVKALGGTIAVFLAALAYMSVSYARFGLLWGAPGELQVSYSVMPEQRAAMALTDGSFFSARFIPTAAWSYLNPFTNEIRLTRLFPFVRFGEPSRAFLSAPMYMTPTGTVLTSAPALLVVGVVGAWVLIRRGDTAWRVAAIASTVGACMALAFWSVQHRYLADFVPMLIVLGVVGFWSIHHRLTSESKRRRRLLTTGLVLLMALGTLAQASLSLWSHWFFLFPDFDEAVSAIELRYSIDRALFGGSPPELLRVRADTAPSDLPPVGSIEPSSEVLVAGDCDAIYARVRGVWASWRSFERRSGGDRRAVIRPRRTISSASALVVRGNDWTIRTAPGPRWDTTTIVYANEGGLTASGVIRLDTKPVLLDVVADPFTKQVQVLQNGRLVIDLVTDASDGLEVASDWKTKSTDAPKCEAIAHVG